MSQTTARVTLGVRSSWPVTVAVWSLAIAWGVCAIAWVLIVSVDVESVMITGPIVFALGIVAVTTGFSRRYGSSILLGACHVSIVNLFVLLVNIFAWSPSDAETPFAAMGLIYVIVTAPLTVWVWRHRPVLYQPWQCQTCGYPLFGLAGANCPECGLAFDSARVAATQPADAPTKADPLERQ